MPTFTKPTSFYTLRRSAPPEDLRVSDLAGILAEHIGNFLACPAAYAGLSAITVDSFLSSLQVTSDPEALLQNSVSEWIFVTPGPAPVKSEQHYGLEDLGMQIHNNMSPLPRNDMAMLRFAAGSLPSRGLLTLERSLLIGVCTGTRAGTFRAADAIYTWLSDLSDVWSIEFNCRQVNLAPVQVPGEAEKPLFAGFNGNPAIIQMTAIYLRNNRRSLSVPA